MAGCDLERDAAAAGGDADDGSLFVSSSLCVSGEDGTVCCDPLLVLFFVNLLYLCIASVDDWSSFFVNRDSGDELLYRYDSLCNSFCDTMGVQLIEFDLDSGIR